MSTKVYYSDYVCTANKKDGVPLRIHNLNPCSKFRFRFLHEAPYEKSSCKDCKNCVPSKIITDEEFQKMIKERNWPQPEKKKGSPRTKPIV